MRTSYKTALLFAALIGLMLLFAAPASAAANAEAAIAALKTPDGEIVGISNGGESRNAPEQSEAAIEAAAKTGIGLVKAEISLTKDGVPVLLRHNAARRMLGLPTENTGDYTLEELQAKGLRNRAGGKMNPETDQRVLTLPQFLELTGKLDVGAVIAVDAENAEKAAEAIRSANAAGRAALMLTGKAKAVKTAAASFAGEITVLASHRSNVIFDVTGFAKAMAAAGAAGVNWQTTNRYGVVWYPSVVAKTSKSTRAVADTSEPETCGARTDAVKWWDDLISRGYSVIITDDAERFAEYLAETKTARERLQALADGIRTEWQAPAFRDALSDYKKAYTDALTQAETLLSDPSSACRDLNDCYADLTRAKDEIDRHYEALEDGTAERAVTLPRILLCAAAAAAVALVQIYFYKKRKTA